MLYVLDEPSIGLHQRDNRGSSTPCVRLRDLGNTVIVVEHDEETIRAADHVVDIGPAPGSTAARSSTAGPCRACSRARRRSPGSYLTGPASHPGPDTRRRPGGRAGRCAGAASTTCRTSTSAFPLGCLVAVTGVSGSGKSTLVNDILLQSLLAQVHRARTVPGRTRAIEGVEHIDKVVAIDQSPIGRTPRSNPATYTGVFDHIRRLFSQTTEAKVRGYQPGRFSFNVRGGRCEACAGDGTIKIEMHFLPDVYVPCEVCEGARYNRETLEVTFKGKNIADVLDMSLRGGAGVLRQPAADRPAPPDPGRRGPRLHPPGTARAHAVGGRGTAREARVRVVAGARPATRSTSWTSRPRGCTSRTCASCSRCCHRLVDQGNTVIVIEHNLDVIKTADWIIDLGPEGGERGGTVVAEGTPEDVAATPLSYTGQVLGTRAGPGRPRPTERLGPATTRRPPVESAPSRPSRPHAHRRQAPQSGLMAVVRRDHVARWLEGYEEAWRTPGTERLAELFTPDVRYSSSPWAEPVVGLDDLALFWEAERDGPDEAFAMSSEVIAIEAETAVVRCVGRVRQRPRHPVARSLGPALRPGGTVCLVRGVALRARRGRGAPGQVISSIRSSATRALSVRSRRRR